MTPVGETPPLLGGLAIAASGLSAQRRRMDVIAMNIANAETTRTPEGGPYQRRYLELVEAPQAPADTRMSSGVGEIEVPRVPRAGAPLASGPTRATGVQVAGVSVDGSEGALVYEPGHPDADEQGYVRYPNVDLTQETIALMETRRAYEANATVFEAMKGMLRRALEI